MQRDTAVTAQHEAEAALAQLAAQHTEAVRNLAAEQEAAAEEKSAAAQQTEKYEQRLQAAQEVARVATEKYNKMLPQLADAANKQLEANKRLQAEEAEFAAKQAADEADAARQAAAFDDRLSRAKSEIDAAKDNASSAATSHAGMEAEMQRLNAANDTLRQQLEQSNEKFDSLFGDKIGMQFKAAIDESKKLGPEEKLRTVQVQLALTAGRLDERNRDIVRERSSACHCISLCFHCLSVPNIWCTVLDRPTSRPTAWRSRPKSHGFSGMCPTTTLSCRCRTLRT